MRNVALTVRIPVRNARTALTRIADFERFPSLAADVREVRSRAAESDWMVHFRRGLLRWTERDTVDSDRLRIGFEQVTGDFATFSGAWQLVPGSRGCVVRFTAAWDFGIESMAGIMDPIAERVIRRVVCDVLTGLFGPTTVHEGGVDLERVA